MPHKHLCELLIGLVAMCTIRAPAFGDGEAPTPSVPERPAIKLNRWQEDWSVLADPRLRTEPLDSLKYIPLNRDDPKSYLSLGLTLRERFETNDAPSFGVGNNSQRQLSTAALPVSLRCSPRQALAGVRRVRGCPRLLEEDHHPRRREPTGPSSGVRRVYRRIRRR